MTPYISQVKHDPPETFGDCLRACIASLLDVESPLDVPNFAENGEHPVFKCQEWLCERDMRLFLTQFPASASASEVMGGVSALNPNTHYLLFSADHVVICRDNKIVHDPAWYKVALKQPTDAWTVGVLVSA